MAAARHRPRSREGCLTSYRSWLSALVMLAAVRAGPASAQYGPPELVRLVDSPTAGLVDKGQFAIDLRLFSGGGLMGQVDAGLLRRLAIGLAFGGEGVIGGESVDWHPRVEAAARCRLVEESTGMPALTAGYDTQGYGAYSHGRYQVRGKGIYLASSKNYGTPLGQLGFHGGLNWSLEEEGGGLSGWLGADKRFSDRLIFIAEYDLARAGGDDSWALNRGYANGGAHWSPTPSLRLGFLLKNFLQNGDRTAPGGPSADLSREISVRYSESF